MKKVLQLILILELATLATGCASTGGYFVDRGRDVADIVTVTVGLGLGGKVRVGKAQVGLLVQGDAFGLRGGTLEHMLWKYCVDYDLLFLFNPVDCQFGQEDYHSFKMNVRDRDKAYKSDKRNPLTQSGRMPDGARESEPLPACYYSQIEAVAGLGPSVRLGFNPGELLDFILGWTTIDIYNDDLERRKKTEQ